MVVEAAQSDDHVFASSALRELAFEDNLDAARNLPPEFPRGPYCCCVSADDGSADGPERTIHVGMRIGGDNERPGHHVSALDHDLVADARTRWIEFHAMLFGKCFDRAVLLQIGFVPVLDVVIESEDKLRWIVNLFGANALELAHDRRGVVVGHDAMRADGNEVTGAQRAFRAFGEMGLRDFFNDGLGHNCSCLKSTRG